MRFADSADQGVGSCNDDAATDSEKEHEQHDRAEALRPGQQKERKRDACETENEAYFVALSVEQRTDANRRDHQAKRLRECDGSVLRRREVETI